MGKLFGTDGIRGVANETLDAKLAYRVGQAAAISLCDDSGTKPTVVIGKDTRISSDMLEGALVAGLTACGCNAILLGVVPTPAVAYLTIYLHADAGVVISASHNPYEHNGIKMFSSEGFKLNDALEARIEELILQDGELPVKTHGEIGQVMSGSFAAEYYLDHLASTVDGLEPLRVLIDCANGAASTTARYLFGRFPLQAEYLSDKPNGVNINEGCGSTHLEALCAAVKDGGYDLGIAFDGVQGEKLCAFDPYLPEEPLPEKDIVMTDDHPYAYNRVIPFSYFNHTGRTQYALGETARREAVLLFNTHTELTEEQTVEYVI